MSMFGYANELANELYRILDEMIEKYGISYTLHYLGESLSFIGESAQLERPVDEESDHH
jgi:hypothetical protein